MYDLASKETDMRPVFHDSHQSPWRWLFITAFGVVGCQDADWVGLSELIPGVPAMELAGSIRDESDVATAVALYFADLPDEPRPRPCLSDSTKDTLRSEHEMCIAAERAGAGCQYKISTEGNYAECGGSEDHRFAYLEEHTLVERAGTQNIEIQLAVPPRRNPEGMQVT